MTDHEAGADDDGAGGAGGAEGPEPSPGDAPADEPPEPDATGGDGRDSPGVENPRDPPQNAGQGGPGSGGVVAGVRWFLTTDDETVAFVREFGRSAAAVLLVGVLLFAVSGVWPPMVAVESPSMEPHMQPGDLVFLMEEDRLVPAAAQPGTGVVPRAAAEPVDYRRFGGYGDVIVYVTPQRQRRGQPPIIHRAQFWVEEGENWHKQADPEYVAAGSCDAARFCPAPHAGFITRGDANAYYDQSQGLSPPVRPEWVRGTAEVRVPWLGCVRLYFEGGNSVPSTCRV
ncbi:MAG: S26 family signal peptidase [Halobacteriaceae archaeon]